MTEFDREQLSDAQVLAQDLQESCRIAQNRLSEALNERDQYLQRVQELESVLVAITPWLATLKGESARLAIITNAVLNHKPKEP